MNLWDKWTQTQSEDNSSYQFICLPPFYVPHPVCLLFLSSAQLCPFVTFSKLFKLPPLSNLPTQLRPFPSIAQWKPFLYTLGSLYLSFTSHSPFHLLAPFRRCFYPKCRLWTSTLLILYNSLKIGRTILPFHSVSASKSTLVFGGTIVSFSFIHYFSINLIPNPSMK